MRLSTAETSPCELLHFRWALLLPLPGSLATTCLYTVSCMLAEGHVPAAVAAAAGLLRARLIGGIAAASHSGFCSSCTYGELHHA
jgi:hypothetical protein